MPWWPLVWLNHSASDCGVQHGLQRGPVKITASINRVAVRSEKLLAFESMAKDLEPMLQLDHVLSDNSQVFLAIPIHIAMHISVHISVHVSVHMLSTHMSMPMSLYTILRCSTNRPGLYGRLSRLIPSGLTSALYCHP